MPAGAAHGCTHEAAMSERGGAPLVNPGEGCGWLTRPHTTAVLDLDARRGELPGITGDCWRT